MLSKHYFSHETPHHLFPPFPGCCGFPFLPKPLDIITSPSVWLSVLPTRFSGPLALSMPLLSIAFKFFGFVGLLSAFGRRHQAPFSKMKTKRIWYGNNSPRGFGFLEFASATDWHFHIMLAWLIVVEGNAA